MPEHQKTPEPLVRFESVGRKTGGFHVPPRIMENPVACLGLQQTALNIQYLVKGAGYVQAQSKADVRTRIAKLLGQQPPSGGTGKLHFVPVVKLLTRAAGLMHANVAEPADMGQGLRYMTLFVLELLAVVQKLPLASAAPSTIR